MNNIIKILSVLVLASVSQVALGHPGHGLEGGSFSFLHYLAEPEHLMLLLTIAVGVGFTVKKAIKKID